MDPVKNKRLLKEACGALGIQVDALDSPHDLYAKVTYQRKMQKKTAPVEKPTDGHLDEQTFKAAETQRLVQAGFPQGDESLTSEVAQRWKVVRDSVLSKNAEHVIFVDRETSKNKELMDQFSTDHFKLLVSEAGGFHFVPWKTDALDAVEAEASEPKKTDAVDDAVEAEASEPKEMAEADPKKMAVEAAMRRMQANDSEKPVDADAASSAAADGDGAVMADAGAEKQGAAATDATGEEAGGGKLTTSAEVIRAIDDLKTEADKISIDKARAQFVAYMDEKLGAENGVRKYVISRILGLDDMEKPKFDDPDTAKQALTTIAEAMFPKALALLVASEPSTLSTLAVAAASHDAPEEDRPAPLA